MNINLRVLEFGIVAITAVFTAYLYLDSIHADREEFKKAELELKHQMIKNELNRDHFARRRYEDLINEGKATETDKVRYNYLMLDIQNRESEKELVEHQLSRLEE